MAAIDIISLFKPGNGPTITFAETAFEAREAIIDGKTVNFADWLSERNSDIRFPLVADYSGEAINVGFQSVDRAAAAVRFHAPVAAKLAVPSRTVGRRCANG